MLKNFKQIDSHILLKHFIVFALFFPFFTSKMENAFFPDFILVNVFVSLFIIIVFLQKRIQISTKDFLALSLTVLLFLYNLTAFYMNKKYLHWYSDQMNVSIAFLFFITLLLAKPSETSEEDKDKNFITFLIHTIVISNAVGIVVYLLGHTGVSFLNGRIQWVDLADNYYERRFNWIYLHKSQYALMLVLFLAFFAVYRKYFRNKWTYAASVGVLFIGLMISHTYTSLFAALFIFAGQFCDFMKERLSFLKLKHLLFSVPVLGIAFYFVYRMARERNIGTLGGRLPIWRESLHILSVHRAGIGTSFGSVSFDIPGLTFDVYNCHNLFLNQMLRFSIPVGLCYIVMFGLIIIVSVKRNLSFLTIGIWMALLIPMNMDYALLPTELPMFLFILFLIFFRKEQDA